MALVIERKDDAFNAQLKNFANKISMYGTTLGLTAGEIASIKADSLAVDYIFGNQRAMQTSARNYTAFKKMLRRGGGQSLGSVPVAPALGTAPPMPAANIEARFRSILQRITHHAAYTSAMGEDLGIEGAEVVFNSAAGKPKFSIVFATGGCPNLRWKKGKFQGVEIWKDSGNGFVKLDRDMRPDYIDKSPLPAAGVSAVWRYKMIYLMNDEVAGSWSDLVSVTVHGEV